MDKKKQRMPGLICPHCGNFIPTSIQQILNLSILYCPHCGLKLTINNKATDKALKIIDKLK